MKRVTLIRPVRKGTSYVKETKPSQAQTEKKESVEDLLSKANLLSPTERKELLAKLSLASQTKLGEETRDIDMWAQAVYDGLVSVIGADGEGVPGPTVVKRLLAVPTAWAPVSSFMRASKMDQVTVSQRQSAYHMLANLVIENARYVARTSRIPLSPKLVGNCASNITGIFDQAFPGYLQSGLAHIVVRRLTDSKTS